MSARNTIVGLTMAVAIASCAKNRTASGGGEPMDAAAPTADVTAPAADADDTDDGARGDLAGPAPDVSAPGDAAAEVGAPSDREAQRAALEAALASAATFDAAGLVTAHAVTFAKSLGYDPLAASNLSLIQSSKSKLEAGELDALGRNGFVLSRDKIFPGFMYGYETIYAADLPVFISADSVLHAIHRSYDDILMNLELALTAELHAMLDGMRAGLKAGVVAPLGQAAVDDADFYLAVALGLLDDAAAAPVAGASATAVASLVAKARAAQGTEELEVLGVSRQVDFSQFKPRGHYLGVPQLEKYFRAMMWLGRMDLPIIDMDAAGKAIFHRPMFDATMALTGLLDAPALAHWKHIDDTVRAFVGEPDAMEPPDVPKLLAALSNPSLQALGAIPDDQIMEALVAGGYGKQLIASQIVLAPPHAGTLPLATTFLLLGQRYVVDSHVFSNVVYDRVNRSPQRLMPDPLDVAFAALGNDAAAALLQPGLETYHYAPELERMRRLVDAHGADFWNANLYNLWLSSLRALSPETVAATGVAATEPWARRTLNTQLASWAELRHDTILYAKQSYSGGVTCEFPDAYVENNPKFFARLGDFARKGAALAASLDLAGTNAALVTEVANYFNHLLEVVDILGAIATAQQAGTPPTAAHLTFINKAVYWHQGACGVPTTFDGWYPELFFRHHGDQFDPTIADVHTQPTDESGNSVGRVLHVGTGYARLMVMTVETCDGPRAYVGLASSYHERITDNYQRLDDPTWAKEVTNKTPAFTPWLEDLIAN